MWPRDIQMNISLLFFLGKRTDLFSSTLVIADTPRTSFSVRISESRNSGV